MKQINLALELDPYNVINQSFYATVLNYSGRYEEAFEVRRRILETNPHNPMAMGGMVGYYKRKGMYEEYFEALKARIRVRRGPEAVAALERDYAEGGLELVWRRGAESRAAGMLKGYGKPLNIASWYRDAGDIQKTLDWYERAFEERDPGIPYIGLGEKEDLRDEPRFQDLLRRLNFPEDVLAGYLNETQ
jgi:tetratricopeptide (TPR) repeat protein